jgi:hypothetical protein
MVGRLIRNASNFDVMHDVNNLNNFGQLKPFKVLLSRFIRNVSNLEFDILPVGNLGVNERT